MDSAEDIFAAVARVASEHGLPVVVVGGHAVNAFGYFRTTLDADFMICVDDRDAWRGVFEALGYRWQMETEAFIKLKPSGDRSDRLPVDVMLVESDTFSRIRAEAREMQFGRTRLPTPKPLHLIALKLHAMRNPERLRTGKDLMDVLHLIRTCGIDPRGADFLGALDRYANEETRKLIDANLRIG